ncbi:MAG: peptidoglycan bridge formation glycyltransferase FemA/FemB family protein, partial [Anaerococcus sp.]|nr:peptidoglycan bridge formation glycyltransferase FemA/FemB family protein [Anaerococcus sp.]
MPIAKSNEDLERYNNFVRNSSYGRPMQDISWSKVKENWTSDYIYIEENKQIIAAMSVIGIENPNGKYFLYAPRGPVCDFRNYDLVDSLIKEAEVLKDKYDAFLLRMDPEVEFDEKAIYEYQKRNYEVRTFGTDPHSFTQPRYNMILPISGMSEDDLFGSFSSATRRNIR